MRWATVRWSRVSGTRSPGAAAGAGAGPARGEPAPARRGGGRGRGRRPSPTTPRRARRPPRRRARSGRPGRCRAPSRCPRRARRPGAARGGGLRAPAVRADGRRPLGIEVLQGLGAAASFRLRLVGRAGPGVGLLRAELGADLRRGPVVGGGDAGGGVLLGHRLGRRGLGRRGRRRGGARPPISAMGSPTARASPSAAITWRVPSSGASTVIVALSVSISTRGCPLDTASPSATSHWRTVPSSIVSLSLGIRSCAMSGRPLRAHQPLRPRAITSGGEGRANCSRFFA